MSTVEEAGPKAHADDCELVGALSPAHLSQNEVQLFEWARRDRADAIRQLIDERRCDVNVQDNFNRTPLHFAASNGNFNTVKLLVQNRVIIDVVDKYGITPLMWAVYNNHKKVAIYLIENGAKYTRVTKQGHTIFHFIAESNAIGILKYLYQKFHVLKIDTEDHTGMTPFLVAAQRGNLLLMEVFAKQGCFVKKKDRRSRSALHLASWKGNANVVDYLLKLEDTVQVINDTDHEGKSALHLAAESNHKEIMRMLLVAGADPDITSDKQNCPLIESSRMGFHACIDVLLAYGADKDMRGQDGSTAVHVAALANLPETVYHLIRRGCDLHCLNDRGQTPLHAAVEQEKLETVEALLLVGAKLDVKDEAGQTPLDVAARASYVALVDLIIKTERWREIHPNKAELIRSRLLTPEDELPVYNPPRRTHFETYSFVGSEASRNSTDSNRDSRYENESVRERLESKDTAASIRSSNREHDVFDPTYDRVSQDYTESTNGSADLPGAYEDCTNDLNSEHEDSVHTLTPHISSKAASKVSSHATANTVTNVGNDLPPGFIDPYEMFAEATGSIAPPEEEAFEPGLEKAASVITSDELSLGYEAANAWGRVSSGSSRQIPEDENLYEHPMELEHAESIYAQSMDQSRIAGSCVMQERRLSNGELIVSIYDPAQARRMRAEEGSTMSENSQQEFTLLKYPHPCAEEMKVIFFKLSHKHLKPEDWIELAKYWKFKEEHIAAIQYQDTGKYSYQDHGYRMLGIWLFNIDPDQSPVNELYLSLLEINRPKLARKLRSKVEIKKKGTKGCKVQ